MRFSCEKSILLCSVTTAARAVAGKSTIPALEGILIEAKKGLRFTGYNLETGICTEVAAEVEEEGSIVLNSRLFVEIIRKLSDEAVFFSTDEKNVVTIKCGSSEFNISGLPASEFPEMPAVEQQNSLSIAERSLKAAIADTIFAVSDNVSRPILKGSLLEIEEDNLTIVSVDGYRLALRKEKLKERAAVPYSFVVPGSALGEVEKIAADKENMAIITQGSRHIMFKINETIIISRRLEGEFLPYKNAIPKNNEIKFYAEKKKMIESFERVSLIIDEKIKSPVRCKVGEGMMRLEANTAVGKAFDAFAISGDGKDLEIGIDNRYMLEALKAAPAEKIRVEMNTAVSPCILLPADGEENFLYMILPMRLRANE